MIKKEAWSLWPSVWKCSECIYLFIGENHLSSSYEIGHLVELIG